MRYYARAFTPSGESSGALANLFNWFFRARDGYFSLPRFQFEAMTLGLAVFFGLLVMPALIFLAGDLALKNYANGGVFALYGDFYKGLFEPRPAFWAVVAGPFVFLSLLRLFRSILRKL
jgi:hypothetical protein